MEDNPVLRYPDRLTQGDVFVQEKFNVTDNPILQLSEAPVKLSERLNQRIVLITLNPVRAISEITHATAADYTESINKARTKRAIGGVILLESIGVTRLPSIGTIDLAFHVANNGPSPWSNIAAGVLAATVQGGWGYFATRVVNNTVDNLPKTCAALGSGLPAVDKLPELFPSLDVYKESKTLISKAGSSIRHGAGAVAALGPQIYAAGIMGMPAKDRRILGRRLSINGGLFMGSALSILTGLVTAVGESNPQLASDIIESTHSQWQIFAAFTGIQGTAIATKRTKKWLKDTMSRKNGVTSKAEL